MFRGWTSVRISVPFNHLLGYPCEYPCGCPCRIIRARTVRLILLSSSVRSFRISLWAIIPYLFTWWLVWASRSLFGFAQNFLEELESSKHSPRKLGISLSPKLDWKTTLCLDYQTVLRQSTIFAGNILACGHVRVQAKAVEQTFYKN